MPLIIPKSSLTYSIIIYRIPSITQPIVRLVRPNPHTNAGLEGLSQDLPRFDTPGRLLYNYENNKQTYWRPLPFVGRQLIVDGFPYDHPNRKIILITDFLQNLYG